MRPDSPCVAVCTTLYDEVCKGCGRTYIEVANWVFMTEDEREVVWQRIDAEATAWRYRQLYKCHTWMEYAKAIEQALKEKNT